MVVISMKYQHLNPKILATSWPHKSAKKSEISRSENSTPALPDLEFFEISQNMEK